MSTGKVEEGLIAFFTSALNAETLEDGEGDSKIEFLGFEVSGVTVGLRAFTGAARIPELLPACIIQCESNKGLGGRGSTLRRAVLKFHFLTPRNVEGYTAEIHAEIQAAVMDQFSAEKDLDISAALSAAGAGASQGWGDLDAQDQHSAGYWITVHSVDPFGLRVV
jgi:hypothetical protein